MPKTSNEEQQVSQEFIDFEDDAAPEDQLDDDFEVEIEDDTPEEDRGKEPMPKEVVEELEKDELEDYDDRVKQRLKQAKKIYHDERREKEREAREKTEALSLAQRFYAENQKLKETLSNGQNTLVESFKSTAELEAEKARKAYREAYESGDPDKLIEAQEQLQEAQLKLHQLRNYRPPSQEENNAVNTVQEQVVQAPRPDPKTLAWQERNTWWGNDEEMTASALGLHQKLVKQYGGNYAGTDEYWQSIDTTMRRRFPEYFGEPEKQTTETNNSKSRAATIVAPASRSTSAKKIVLTKSQLSIAKRLGLTPEQYARELKKVEG